MGMVFGLEKGQCNFKDVIRVIKMVFRVLELYVIGELTIIVFQIRINKERRFFFVFKNIYDV